MALSALGASLTAALGKLGKAPSVDEDVLKTCMNDVCRALLDSDVSFALVMRLKKAVEARVKIDDEAAGVNWAKVIEKCVVEELVRMLEPGRAAYKPKRGKANVVMFVGLQGAGKTTTVAKFAHYYQSRKWKVAMVCADTFRAGAFDQLKQNATRVRVPFYGSYTEADPVTIAREGVAQFKAEGYEVIIVDTSGRHKQEAGLFEEMQAVAAAVVPDDVVFVMDGSIGQAAFAQAEAFKAAIAVGSVVITKLDGHAKGGGALSAVAATGSPIVFIGTGESFDDLAPFDASRFIGKLLGKGDISGLVAELKEKGILEASEDLMSKVSKSGGFSIRDLKEQFAQLMKLGSMSKILEMIPGMAPMLAAAGGEGGGDPSARFKRFLVVMDSMTPEELDCDVEISDSRAMRIMRGSGSHPQELRALIDLHKQFEKMMVRRGVGVNEGVVRSGVWGKGPLSFCACVALLPPLTLLSWCRAQ